MRELLNSPKPFDSFTSRRIVDWIVEKSQDGTCRVCGTIEFEIDPYPVYLPISKNKGVQLAAIICKNCKMVTLHSVKDICF